MSDIHYELGKEPFATGSDGVLYNVVGKPQLVAKIAPVSTTSPVSIGNTLLMGFKGVGPKVYDIHYQDQNVTLVMDKMKNVVSESIKRNEITPEEVVSQVSILVQKMANMGKIHGSLHEENIMISVGGEIKLIDFDLVIEAHETSQTSIERRLLRSVELNGVSYPLDIDWTKFKQLTWPAKETPAEAEKRERLAAARRKAQEEQRKRMQARIAALRQKRNVPKREAEGYSWAVNGSGAFAQANGQWEFIC